MNKPPPADTLSILDKVITLAKRRGFVYPSCEIYGGLSGFYDYGPLGVEMKNNLKKLWWNFMVRKRKNVVGIDGSIITHKRVWEASGHLENFHEPLVECKNCKRRFRADHLKEEGHITCPECSGPLSEAREFNIMVSTELGVVEGEKETAFLRGEACQSIYLDYDSVSKTTRQTLPFGIAQIGKAFRNEITPKNFLFRQREFEQWDLQYFTSPQGMESAYEYWKNERMRWYKSLINEKDNLRFRKHDESELAHYAKIAFDIEYQYPFGWKELEGIHWRGDWDLSRHGQYSGINFLHTTEDKQTFIPHIVETSGGVDRTFLVFLLDSYHEETVKDTKGNDETRVVLRLHPLIAPITLAILPLSKNEKLSPLASEVYDQLAGIYSVQYDETGSIGRRYRRQDEIGTPYCVTIDFQSLEDHQVTIRNRDSMTQERIGIKNLREKLDTELAKSLSW